MSGTAVDLGDLDTSTLWWVSAILAPWWVGSLLLAWWRLRERRFRLSLSSIRAAIGRSELSPKARSVGANGATAPEADTIQT